jgi:hypothetical protein
MTKGVGGLTRDKTRKPGKKPPSTDAVQRVVDLAINGTRLGTKRCRMFCVSLKEVRFL